MYKDKPLKKGHVWLKEKDAEALFGELYHTSVNGSFLRESSGIVDCQLSYIPDDTPEDEIVDAVLVSKEYGEVISHGACVDSSDDFSKFCIRMFGVMNAITLAHPDREMNDVILHFLLIASNIKGLERFDRMTAIVEVSRPYCKDRPILMSFLSGIERLRDSFRAEIDEESGLRFAFPTEANPGMLGHVWLDNPIAEDLFDMLCCIKVNDKSMLHAESMGKKSWFPFYYIDPDAPREEVTDAVLVHRRSRVAVSFGRHVNPEDMIGIFCISLFAKMRELDVKDPRRQMGDVLLHFLSIASLYTDMERVERLSVIVVAATRKISDLSPVIDIVEDIIKLAHTERERLSVAEPASEPSRPTNRP